MADRVVVGGNVGYIAINHLATRMGKLASGQSISSFENPEENMVFQRNHRKEPEKRKEKDKSAVWSKRALCSWVDARCDKADSLVVRGRR